MPIDQSSITSAQLFGAGVIGGGGGGQPGPDRPFCVLPSLKFQPLFDISSCGIGSKPIPGIAGMFAQGGSLGRPGQPNFIQKFAASVVNDAKQAHNAGQQILAQSASQLGQQLASSGVAQSQMIQAPSHGLGGLGRGGILQIT